MTGKMTISKARTIAKCPFDDFSLSGSNEKSKAIGFVEGHESRQAEVE